MKCSDSVAILDDDDDDNDDDDDDNDVERLRRERRGELRGDLERPECELR